MMLFIINFYHVTVEMLKTNCLMFACRRAVKGSVEE